jgi:protoporphyrinogen oxidase
MKSEVVIIGAGVTGLAAGMNNDSVILEKENRVGGVVKTHKFGDYWFDNTVHFLLIRDKVKRIEPLLHDILDFSILEVWVETKEGRVRYPFQLNIGGLNEESQDKCLFDFMNKPTGEPENYEQFLINTFGEGMCDIFFFPYNNKSWKFPLNEMTASGQVWNIHKPTSREILDGINNPNITRGNFNTQGYYPVMPKEADQRGMEILPIKMAEKCNVRLNTLVTRIEKDRVTANGDWVYYDNLFSTIPLPALMNMCDIPNSLKKDVAKLKWNKMLSIGISIEGDSPDRGHYCYYADPKIPFNKLTYMHKFDKYSAPSEGYGILLEVKDDGDKGQIIADSIESLKYLDILNDKNKMVDLNVWYVDPAYVVFTKDTPGIIDDCKEFLYKHNITTSGRYGKWEYSSMAENINDGFNYADL